MTSKWKFAGCERVGAGASSWSGSPRDLTETLDQRDAALDICERLAGLLEEGAEFQWTKDREEWRKRASAELAKHRVEEQEEVLPLPDLTLKGDDWRSTVDALTGKVNRLVREINELRNK